MTIDRVALAERAATNALEGLRHVAAVDLTLPTPCPGWDVGHLLVHVADASHLLAGLLTSGEPRLPDPQRSGTADPLGLAADSIRNLREALLRTAPGSPDGNGPKPEQVRDAACGAAIELTAHAWDIGAAHGRSEAVSDALAADVHELATTLITDRDRQPHFGPHIDVPANATATERLVGFLGRDPSWSRPHFDRMAGVPRRSANN